MRNFDKAKRIVVKIGTNTLSKDSSVDTAYVRQIAKQIAALLAQGRQVVIISSGAIGMGAGILDLKGAVQDMKMRQACAAIGQPLLMQEYRKAFSKHDITVAQVLLTAEVLDNRKTYLNLRNSIETLLKLGVVPVLNENDCVATDEIGSAFGDNDKLSARVASKIEADLLILLTDIDALYNKDPRKHKDAKPIYLVEKITRDIVASAGDSGTKHATGGMKSKIEAVKIAFEAGCRIVLANGRTNSIITKIINGDNVGTLFTPGSVKKLNDHERWIANRRPVGQIEIETRFKRKITKPEDILPIHVRSITGIFPKKSVVTLFAGTSDKTFKAITQLDSEQISCFKGKTQGGIKKILGEGFGRMVAIKAGDIVKIKK